MLSDHRNVARFGTGLMLGAFFPETVREAFKDQMAKKGATEDDIRELIRKLESPSLKQH